MPNDLFDLPFEEPEPDPAPSEEPAPEPRSAVPEPAPSRRIWSVSELNSAIRDLLERRFAELWVEGEISNGRLWNGHLFFTLKDEGAQVKAVMFKGALRNLRFKPEDGLHVVARGRVTVYDPKGEYQVLCDHLEPMGAGALQLAFEQLKKRLAAEGLFAAERKRRLPALPRKIGIVTSLEGAAIRDIIKVLRRRYPNAHLVIRPTRVQGEGAGSDVARGLRAITRVPGVDVVIVGRGGGSIEDLWAFNEEVVARAIVDSPVPVVSGVGHEVDYTIADFVADVRAPTPSAAAEMVVAAKDDFCSRIDRLSDRLGAAARSRIQRARNAVHRLSGRPGLAGWPGRVALRGRHVAELTHQLRRNGRALLSRSGRRFGDLRLTLETFDLRRRLGHVRARLLRVEAAARAAAVRAHHRADARLRSQAARLDSLSPLAVLGRGYAVCWDADRTRVIRSSEEVTTGDAVRVTLHQGELSCRVEDTK